MALNYYRYFGIFLTAAGAGLILLAYFTLRSVPLTALGLSEIFLGITSVMLLKTIPLMLPPARKTLPGLLISFAIVLHTIDAVLALLGQNDFSYYYSANAMAYLTIVLIYLSINPSAKSSLYPVSAFIVLGFLGVISIKIVEILA
jgi:hypothetical protein